MFYSPINRIDNSPYTLWSAGVIQREMEHISACISDLSSRLFNTNTVQTVGGQKTFSDLYFQNQSPTYGTVMDWINHDISPVFGAGAVALSRDGAASEGKFTKPNVSGVVMDAALKNPVFSQNSISITGGTDNRGLKVLYVDAPNVPLAAFDSQKLGSIPQFGKGLVQPYYWATSQNCSGTILLGSTGETLSAGTSRYTIDSVTTAVPHFIIAGYNEAKDTVDLVLAHKSKLSELPADYKSLSILCEIPTTVYPLATTQNIYFQYDNGIIRNIVNPTSTSKDVNRPTLDDEFPLTMSQTCIALTSFTKGYKHLMNGQSLLPPNNSAPGETSTVFSPESRYQLYIPFIAESGVIPAVTLVPSKGSPIRTNYAVYITQIITGKYFL